VIEIRKLPLGRFGVYAEGRHIEAFEGRLGAIATAHALAAYRAAELDASVTIASPWGRCEVSAPGLLEAIDVLDKSEMT